MLEMLDIAIGLIFIYLMLSLICSALNEWIAAVFSMRSWGLRIGLTKLLGTVETAKLYEHPLVAGLARKRWFFTKPKVSYIPSDIFFKALLDNLVKSPDGAERTAADTRTGLKALGDDNKDEKDIKKVLQTLISTTKDDFGAFQKEVESWFNDSMQSVTGWYKRKTQVIIFVLALLVASFTNADTLYIVDNLVRDPILRASLVAAAQEQIKNPPKPGDPNSAKPPLEQMKEIKKELDSLHVPLGWVTPKDGQEDPRAWPPKVWGFKLLGILLTAVALSFGAPFWFDLLNKFVTIRSAINPDEAKKTV